MIGLYFLSKFNFVSVYFILWIFHFLLHGFSSSRDGQCHVLAFCLVVRSLHRGVCNLASPRNGKNASLVPGLGTLAGLLLPSKHPQGWLQGETWPSGKWERPRQVPGHRHPLAGTEPWGSAVDPCAQPPAVCAGRSEPLGLSFVTSLSSLESLWIPGIYSCLSTKGFTLIILVNSC